MLNYIQLAHWNCPNSHENYGSARPKQVSLLQLIPSIPKSLGHVFQLFHQWSFRYLLQESFLCTLHSSRAFSHCPLRIFLTTVAGILFSYYYHDIRIRLVFYHDVCGQDWSHDGATPLAEVDVNASYTGTVTNVGQCPGE